jgi:hypothetical protein
MEGEGSAGGPGKGAPAGEDRRDDSAVSQTRNLRIRLDEARQAGGWSMAEVSVLSARKDPYRLDTPSFHRDGAWLAEQIDRLHLRMPVHLRGAHYALVAAGGINKPDGNDEPAGDQREEAFGHSGIKSARMFPLCAHRPLHGSPPSRNMRKDQCSFGLYMRRSPPLARCGAPAR